MAIEYQVEETLTTANGYTCDKTGKQTVSNGGSVTFTNSYTPETIEKEIVKVWDDNND